MVRGRSRYRRLQPKPYIKPSDQYGVSLAISPAVAPPRGPGVWAMPPSIITHAAFKTIMAAQIQAFMLACPVSPTAGRAVRWDQLKVHIQDVARNYCSTFHADRTKQLRALRVRAGLARAAYLADPTSQPALDQLRHTAADLQQHRQQQAATQALRAGVLLHEFSQAWHLGSRGPDLSASSVALPWLSLDPNSASSAGRARLSSDVPDSQPAWMALSRGRRQHWSQRQLQQQAQQQQQPSQQPQPHHSDRAGIGDTVDVLAPPASHPQLSEWRRVWELASAAYFNRQHRVLWWRILHGCVMCGAFSAYIGRATMEQACCPYACCSSPNQPQSISHMFLECPMAATVIGWLCRLWQAVTGHLPDASVATILVASTSEGHCALDALLQTWHRLRLAVLHSIWTAARIAASSTHTSTQASQSSSQSHLASKLALKTIVSMIRHDWVKCTDDVRQLSGVCSSWLRGRDPSMTLQAFRDLWCHHDALASIHTAHTGTEDKLELVVNLSDMVPVQLF
ncbi:hypothetical protein ABBQ32_013096 [Trebouxia sp. C0010 RCD-2024]